jgi:hypothetical protein
MVSSTALGMLDAAEANSNVAFSANDRQEGA